MKYATAFLSGLLFSVGLLLSGMADPNNIIGFLDIAGQWKPALIFVMLGAVAIYAILFPLVTKRRAPFFDARFSISTKKNIDRNLVIGACTFGVGWGLSGLCPGPSLVALGSGAVQALAFFGAMLLGIFLYNAIHDDGAKPLDIDNICG